VNLRQAEREVCFKKSDKSAHTSPEMAAYGRAGWRNTPIVSIEDGMAEGRLVGWKMLTQRRGSKTSKKKIQLVGERSFRDEHGAAVARDQ